MIEEPGQVAGLLVYGVALRIAGSVVTRLLPKAGDVAMWQIARVTMAIRVLDRWKRI